MLACQVHLRYWNVKFRAFLEARLETLSFWNIGGKMLVEEPWDVFFSDDNGHRFLLVF